MTARFLPFVLMLAAAVSCGGSSSYDPARGASGHQPCTMSLARSPAGRPVVSFRCPLPAVPAAPPSGRYAGAVAGRGLQPGEPRLLHLARSTTPSERIDERDIRATAEFRSYMDSYNVWQWGERVTEAEALAACWLMLADLRAGRHVDWETESRIYLERVRQAPAAPARAAQPAGTMRWAAEPPGAEPWAGVPGRDRPPDIPGPPQKEIREIVDPGWELRARLPGDRGDALERMLEVVDAQIGALAVILAGTTITISGLVIAGEAVEIVLVAEGDAPKDMDLALKLSEPLFHELTHNLRQIDRITEHGRTLPGRSVSYRLTAEQRMVYRKLVNRPMELLGQPELERIGELQRRGGLVGKKFVPGTAAHKAERWDDYRRRDGRWPFARWSTTYDQNMTRSSRAHALADQIHKQTGWGEREVRMMFDEMTRVLDIADQNNRRGMEVKSGYVTYTSDVAYELERDAWLVAHYGWSITWHVEGRFSEPLRQALRVASIAIRETHPNTPIKDLRR